MNKKISSSIVALITGGVDRHYACALAKAIASSGIAVDVVGSTDMSSSETCGLSNLRLLPLYGTYRPGQSVLQRLLTYFTVYARLIRYAAASPSPVFHILWDFKFAPFDRTLLLLYYKLLGKKVVFTAHNVNKAERDGTDTFWNRLTLRMQYRLADHIFVHTKKMKDQLALSFGIKQDKVAVIPFGAGGMVPISGLTSAEAKERLGLHESDRAVLFFGRIAKYKGLDLLVDAFARVAAEDPSYRLIIAGESTSDWAQHWEEVRSTIEASPIREQVIQKICHISDEEMEVYFKAADVLALTYREIFQSGVLFMSHSFGLPVIATDVGAFREEIIEGTNGYVCRRDDAQDLARSIKEYFSSELYRKLDEQRPNIQNLLQMSHSWDIVAKITGDVYARVSHHAPLKQQASSPRST
jgi:D-inositol-3-phosphate glycosyltransferase